MATRTVRISTATHATLRRLAGAEGRSMAEVVAEAIARYDRERALAELNTSYAKLAADPAAWANWQAELASVEGTLMDGLNDDPWNDLDSDSLRGAAGTLDRPLPWS